VLGPPVTDLGGLPSDARARKVAARLQAQHPRWLIIWSPWRQQFTAFGRFAPVPIVIDEATPGELLKAMHAQELRFARPLRSAGVRRSRVAVAELSD
jgi:hypothetical protein